MVLRLRDVPLLIFPRFIRLNGILDYHGKHDPSR